MTFDRINRRTHLYLGIALTPWFLVYALSSVILNHRSVEGRQPEPRWTLLFDREYHLPAITEDSDPWALGEQILTDTGMPGRYRYQFDDDDRLVILRQRFLSTIRFTYDPHTARLRAESRPLRWNEFLTQAHFRAGYSFPYATEILWAITIDLLVAATLTWIVSGIILWIRLGRFRLSGLLTLLAGIVSFLLTVLF